MKHNCLDELLKRHYLFEVKSGTGRFTLDGLDISNDSDRDIYILILESTNE